MRDTIYRQDAVMEIANHLGIPAENWMKIAEEWLRDVPPAQPEEIALHESCTDCPLYDKDRHSCPRFNKVIPEVLREAQPEQHWIPVTERLPEEKKDVLIAFKHNMAVGFWEDILDNGEPVWYANSGDGWMTDTANVDSDGIPIAWMPLPDPWRGEQNAVN